MVRGEVMTEVILIPKRNVDIKLEADIITPDSFAGKSAEEIGNLSIWQGPRTLSSLRIF